MKTIELTTPLSSDDVKKLHAGDKVLLSGNIYTARDAAHKRFCELLESGKELPLSLNGQVIYFAGPTPPRPGKVIGSAGPTTSYRMDDYSPMLISRCGLRAMIGKGNRSAAVVEAMRQYQCVYFAATGGAAALIAGCIKECEIVCYEDLGAEAVRRLRVEKMPLIVAIDAEGHNLYER